MSPVAVTRCEDERGLLTGKELAVAVVYFALNRSQRRWTRRWYIHPLNQSRNKDGIAEFRCASPTEEAV